VLHGVKAGALGEHPAGEDALHLAGELHLVDLNEGGRIRRLGRRPRVADARSDLQRAELHRLVQRDFQVGDAARHLVQGGEYGDGILDDLGPGGVRGEQRDDGQGQRPRESRGRRTCRAAHTQIISLHHAAHDVNGPFCDHSGALLG